MCGKAVCDGKKLSAARFAALRGWICRNARNVDLAAFRVGFEGARAEEVAAALLPYQCENGGFGHALQADNWNPQATPVTTVDAYLRLRAAGLVRTEHPLVRGICRYFESGDGQIAQGWAFCVRENDGHPHAPWWSFSEEGNAKEYLGVSCQAAAIGLLHAEESSAFKARSRALAAGLLGGLDSAGSGDMALDGLALLIEALETPRGLDGTGLNAAAVSAAKAKLRAAVGARIERDPSKWGGYVVRPAQAIHSPESAYLAGNEEILALDLDSVVDSLPEGDAWPIPWTWFDLMGKYGAQFAVAETWWKAVKAIEKLSVLRAFGRIEGLRAD